MVNSVSGSFANNKLTITVNGVSSSGITIDTTGTVYTQGTGIKITSGTISIDDTVVALKSDISDMETKTNANATFETKSNASATYATKTALNNLQNSVGDAFSAVAVGADGKSLDFTALDGQVNNIAIPTSDSWEKITNKAQFTNFKIGDILIGKTLQGYDSYSSFNIMNFTLTCVSINNTKGIFSVSGIGADSSSSSWKYYSLGYVSLSPDEISINYISGTNEDTRTYSAIGIAEIYKKV